MVWPESFALGKGGRWELGWVIARVINDNLWCCLGVVGRTRKRLGVDQVRAAPPPPGPLPQGEGEFMHRLCIDYASTMHQLCIDPAFTVHSLCIHCAFTVHRPCITVHRLRIACASTMRRLCIAYWCRLPRDPRLTGATWCGRGETAEECSISLPAAAVARPSAGLRMKRVACSATRRIRGRSR